MGRQINSQRYYVKNILPNFHIEKVKEFYYKIYGKTEDYIIQTSSRNFNNIIEMAPAREITLTILPNFLTEKVKQFYSKIYGQKGE